MHETYSFVTDIFLTHTAALLSISVRLRCSFSVSSLTLRRSSSSAFRNSLSPAAWSLRWLCSASSASSSLTRPLSAWHKRPLWLRRGVKQRQACWWKAHFCCSLGGFMVFFMCECHIRALHLQSERLQLVLEGLDLPGQLFDQTISDGEK